MGQGHAFRREDLLVQPDRIHGGVRREAVDAAVAQDVEVGGAPQVPLHIDSHGLQAVGHVPRHAGADVARELRAAVAVEQVRTHAADGLHHDLLGVGHERIERQPVSWIRAVEQADLFAARGVVVAGPNERSFSGRRGGRPNEPGDSGQGEKEAERIVKTMRITLHSHSRRPFPARRAGITLPGMGSDPARRSRNRMRPRIGLSEPRPGRSKRL